MILLLGLIFIGQATASAVMPYHMMNTGGMTLITLEQSYNMSEIEDASHHVASASNFSSSDESVEDCCAETSECHTNGCSSPAVFHESVSNDFKIDYAAKINFATNLAKSQALTSLYRPPILS